MRVRLFDDGQVVVDLRGGQEPESGVGDVDDADLDVGAAHLA